MICAMGCCCFQQAANILQRSPKALLGELAWQTKINKILA